MVVLSESSGGARFASGGGATGFASGVLQLGDELEASQALELETVWESEGAVFLKPARLPQGFHCIGHHVRGGGGSRDRGLLPHLLLLRQAKQQQEQQALSRPVDYRLVWTSPSSTGGGARASFWLPLPPPGYAALGCIVTRGDATPELEEVMCVRKDLTARGLAEDAVFSWDPPPPPSAFPWPRSLFCGAEKKNREAAASGNAQKIRAWAAKPATSRGSDLSLGTFYCSKGELSGGEEEGESSVVTLRNDHLLEAMPNKDELEALLSKQGPVVLFHPDESFFPASVSWFFERGALLYSRDNPTQPTGVELPDGANLPIGGSNDGAYWLNLPDDSSNADEVRRGDLSAAVAYVHAKAMLGGTATDVQLWFFFPFNGPASLKLGPMTIRMSHVGEHVCDWEHVTLRFSNLDASLVALYMGRHSSGAWYRPAQLEWDAATSRPLVYASRHGHAMYAHPGDNLQGAAANVEVGIRNDTADGGKRLDTAAAHTLVSASYLGADAPQEPRWLDYAREWGPTVRYPAGNEVDKLLNKLPSALRRPLRRLVDAFPDELSGEEGPVGPKQKDYWFGDER